MTTHHAERVEPFTTSTLPIASAGGPSAGKDPT